jgi:predicted nuclease of predicted toxin-antitoxin system
MGMNFKLDENMPVELAEELIACGHDADTCADEGICGAKDPQVAAHARQADRILATFDLDTSDIRRYPPGSHPGMIVFRLGNQDLHACASAFARVLALLPEADFNGNLVIVEDSRVRIRRPAMPSP